MAELKVVGKNFTRVDAPDKVTGKTKYAGDYLEPTLHAKILRSPHAHANIVNINTSQAEKLPGVRGIITPEDSPKARTGYILCKDKYILPLDGRVRYIGEPIAIAVADTEDIAEAALELIDIKYEVLDAVFNAEESMNLDCPVVIHPEKDDYSEPGVYLMGCVLERDIPNGCATLNIRRGDVEKGFAEADVIVENRYTSESGSQGRPELYVMDAWLDGDVYTVRTARTRMWGCHGWLCGIFGLPPSKVRMITPFTGGAFGGKGTVVPEALALMAAKKTGKKVRLAYTREEEFLDTNMRPPVVVYVKDGVKKDGTLVARQVKTIIDIGSYGAAGGTISGFTSQQGLLGIYKCPNLRCDSYTVYTNHPPTGTMRGVEGPQICWAVESNLDECAKAIGMDPLEIRRKNVVDEGDISGLGQVLTNIAPRECLEKVAELLEWDKKPVSDDKWKRGMGMAIANYGAGPWWPAGVTVKVYRDGTIEARIGTDESGQGLIQTMSQFAAESFNTSVEKVKIIRGDTQIVPWDWGSVASRSTWMTGNALLLACKDAKQKLIKMGENALKIPANELEIVDGSILSKKSPDKKVSFTQLFEWDFAFGEGEIIGHGGYEAPHTKMEPFTGNSPNAFPSHSYQAYGMRVAVNIETGEVKVEKAVSAADIGQPVNYKMAEGQVEGSIGQGIGCALYEKFDRANGVILNPNFSSYKCPTAPEIPDIKDISIAFVGKPHPDGPYGAKALGEMGLLPFSASIGNAVANALNMRLKDAPITRERVFMSLQNTKE
ncbi:xanthine dehydrogenase family protein molybdopterin-binding subunit [Chloroflexota bacterium]